MKRFLVSLIVAIPLAFGFIAFTAPSTTQTGPPVPGPTNPYCNSTNLHPVPVFICPEGFALDPACVTSCYNAFYNDVRAAYDQACISYNNVNNFWTLQMNAAAISHSLCVLNATTMEEVETCEAELISAVVTATNNLNSGRARVDQGLSNAITSATAAYLSCVSLCCTIIEYPH